jgi:hypothetical protein
MAQGSHAEACRCREPTIQQAYRRAELIVYGTVVDVTSRAGADRLHVTLEVGKVWKGSADPTIAVTSGSNCRFEPARGRAALLYLVRSATGEWTTGRCMGNSVGEAASARVPWLDQHAKNARSHGGRRE